MYLQRRMINNTKIPMGAFHSAHNEKTFRDLGSGFVEILSYKLWDNCSKTVAWGDKFIIWSC